MHKKVVALPISRYKSTRYRLQGTEVQGTDYRVQGTEVLQGTGYRGTGLRVQGSGYSLVLQGTCGTQGKGYRGTGHRVHWYYSVQITGVQGTRVPIVVIVR